MTQPIVLMNLAPQKIRAGNLASNFRRGGFTKQSSQIQNLVKLGKKWVSDRT